MVHMLLEVPRSMRDYSQSPEAREKPYNICLFCPSLCVSCDGPNILAMEYPRWVEWASQRMKARQLKYAELALASGLSLPTVKSALSGKGYDIRTETMREITRVLIGGCWGQFPCHLAAMLMEGQANELEPPNMTQADRERYDEHIRQMNANFESQLRQAKEEAQAKIDYLKEQVSHWKEEASHWKEEARIRTQFSEEKNARIDDLMDRLLGQK